MTRRSWILATAAVGMPGKGQVCSGGYGSPNEAPPKLFPAPLQTVSPVTLFDCPGYNALPVMGPVGPGGVRLPVNQMTQSQNAGALSLLRAGYQHMLPDMHVTGFSVQATLHEKMCSTRSVDAHGFPGGAFLAWHRAFLYFHERVLRWQLEQAGVANADQVRIPYWDVTSFSESGGIYCSFPELMNSCGRTWDTPDSETATEAVQYLRSGLNDANLRDCTEDLYEWHVAIHNYVGGNMAQIPYAAFDPIFFALHASVDRMWTISQSAKLTPDKHICAFVDPYAVKGPAWVQVDLANFGASADLGISYAPPGGTPALLLELPVPAVVGITLPAGITAGTTLHMAIGSDDFSLGRVPPDSPHGSHHDQERFPIEAKLGNILRKTNHGEVEFYLRNLKGSHTRIDDSHWRLLL